MNGMQTTKFYIATSTIVRILIAIAAFLLLFKIGTMVTSQLIWIASAFFLAIALNPGVEFFRSYMPRRSRGLAVAVVFLLMIGILTFLLLTLVPVLIQQTAALIDSVPDAIQKIQSSDSPISDTLRRYNVEEAAAGAINDVLKAVAGATGSVISIAQGIFSGAAALLTILTLTIFMLIEGPKWVERMWAYHPAHDLERDKMLLKAMYTAVSSYFSGVLLIASISAVSSAVVMTLVGLPYAIPLGLIVGLFGLIPMVGATLAAVVVVLVALFTSPTAALIMAIYFIIYQQLENNIIQPVVQGKSTELSPLVVTIAIILGASIAGLFGALVAIPVAACIKVLLVYRFHPHAKAMVASQPHPAHKAVKPKAKA